MQQKVIANSIGAFFSMNAGIDDLISLDTITRFANKHQASLTVMQDGEHWFHTEEQMLFLDNWIKESKLCP